MLMTIFIYELRAYAIPIIGENIVSAIIDVYLIKKMKSVFN